MNRFSKSNKGTYVAAKFSDKTLAAIAEFQEAASIPNPVKKDDLHCTLVFSRVNIPFITQNDKVEVSNTAKTKIFETRDGKRALVLAIQDADYLKERHQYGKALGATYDFPDYIPHTTISYDIGLIEFSEDVEVTIPFEVEGEILEDLNLDWKGS